MRQVAIEVMTAAMVAAAGGKGMAQAPPPGGPPQRMAAALGLTDEQKAVWQQAFATMRATAAPLHAQAKAIRADIKALFDAGNPDPAALGQKVIALHAVQEQLKQARATMQSTTTAVLSDEQKVKLEAVKALRWGHHRPWGGPPPPPSQ